MSVTLESTPTQQPGGLSGSILGNRVARTEDPELLTGAATYIADLDLGERALHAVFVRSDIAHGLINSIDIDEARSMPGVVDIWTASELDVAPHHGFAVIDPAFARPPLASERVRFVGEAVAVVFAETAAQGADAADAVWADIEPLPAVTDPEDALADEAPLLRPERGDNLAVVDAPDSAVDLEAISDIVVRGRFVNQRLAVAPMEPHGVAAAPADDGRITVWTSNQFPHGVHASIARATGIERRQLHLITPRVGGGFGGKAGMQHEYTVVVLAAQRLGRPVRWIPTRTEDLQAKDHSRSQVQYAELGCTTDGAFTGLRVRLVGDGGAYPGIGAALPGGTRRMSHGTYAFPQIDFDVAVAATNTPPTGAYRGAGRPEATALLERLVDQAAHQLGIDPIELRERNLLTDDVFPFQTLTGPEYDTGSYRMPLRTAARLIGYDRLRAEQRRRREAGDTVQLGIGVATYVEITGGGGGSEFGKLEVHPDGSATVSCGTLSHGQGHQTTFAMIVSAQTGIPVDRIRLVDGDTDLVPRGGGTGGSRSVQFGGSAVSEATKLVVDRARHLAARVLEADEADIVVDVETGKVGVAGVPAAALSWADLAARSEELDEAPLAADTIYSPDGATFPFGAHISAVEVDVETGRARVRRHVAVDDAGTVINKLLVEGQQHGGIASGLSQVLYEEVRYDDLGNPITSNFADYGLPAAAEMPSFEVYSTETPSDRNVLGAKGIGEASTIGSTPAIQNAIVDAVSHLGVRHIDLPCTAERVWRAIADAEAGGGDPWREPPAVFAALPKGRTVDDEAAEAADGI